MKWRTLSGRESQVILTLESLSTEVFSLGDIERLAHVSAGHARKLAHVLATKGWIQRLGRGRYLLNPARHGPETLADTDALRVGSHLRSPYFFAYATAANLHGLLTQLSPVYTLATPGRGRRLPVGPLEFQLVHVRPKRFFGSEHRRVRGTEVFVSDRERTVLDCLDRPDLCGGLPSAAEVIYRAKPDLNYERLRRYLRRMGNPRLANRAGYLLEHLRSEVAVPARAIDPIKRLSTPAWVPLGSPSRYGSAGRNDPDWKVVVNVPTAQLLAEVRIR